MKKRLLFNLCAILIYSVIVFILQLFLTIEISFMIVILFAIIQLHEDIYLKK
jgi:hypothetical protein